MICICQKKVVTLHRQIKKTSIMKAITKKLLTLHEAAKQIKNLLSAVAKINFVKCPLSISQIERLIDGGEKVQKFYINKDYAGIRFNEPNDKNLYITINIIWYEEDKYAISII